MKIQGGRTLCLALACKGSASPFKLHPMLIATM